LCITNFDILIVLNKVFSQITEFASIMYLYVLEVHYVRFHVVTTYSMLAIKTSMLMVDKLTVWRNAPSPIPNECIHQGGIRKSNKAPGVQFAI